MAAHLDELEHLAKRLKDVAEMLRSLDLVSPGSKERMSELRCELERIRERMCELVLLSKEKAARDGLH